MMSFTKRILSAVLSAILSTSCMTVYANETSTVETNGGSAEAAVTLKVGESPLASVFSATIPAVIPAAVDTKGVVTVPNNIEIRNNNAYRGIVATDISVQTSGGWNLDDYNSGDFTTVNGRNIGLSLRGDEADERTGKVTLSEGNWAINAGSSLPIDLGLKVNPQSNVGSVGSVATISFTLDWGEGEVPDLPDPSERDFYRLTFVTDEHGSFKDQAKTKDIKKTDLADGQTVKVTFPAVYPADGYAFDKWVLVQDGVESDLSDVIHLSGDITLRAKTMVRETGYAYFTYYAGEHGKIKDTDGQLKSVVTRKVAITGGSLSVPRVDVVADDKWGFRGFVDIKTGSSTLSSDGKNNYFAVATYEDAAITVTYRCEHPNAKIVDPATGNHVSILTSTIYPGADGRFSVSFPSIYTDGSVEAGDWVNTKTGTNATGSGAKMEWVEQNKSFDFSVTIRNAPKTYVHPSAGTGGTISSTDEIYIPFGTTTSMPTATPNPGYRFDGWYYADGARMQMGSNGTDYMLEDEHGTVNQDRTRIDFNIVAKFVTA